MKRRSILAALGLAALAFALGPPVRSQQPADASPHIKELAALQDEYGKAMQAFYATVRNATPDEFYKAQADPARNPSAKTAERAMELAGRAKGTPAEVKIKLFALQAAQQAPGKSGPIIKDFLANHPSASEMETVARALAAGGTEKEKAENAKSLEMLEQKSPHPAVRAAAINARISLAYDTYMGSGDEKTARALAQRLVKEYGETSYGKRAGGLIFQLDNLGIGKVAPDIEAEDQDGITFKLSDYRGKVVVLDFWGWW
jgi:hypothetical protein